MTNEFVTNEFVFGVYGIVVYDNILYSKAAVLAAAEQAKAKGFIADYRVEEKTPEIGTVYATQHTSKGE